MTFKGDPRIISTVLPTSSGACRARNTAISSARGELITGLDDDDEFLPHHVSHLVRQLCQSRAAFVCTTSAHRRKNIDIVRHAFTGRVNLEALRRQNVVGNQVLTYTSYLQSLGGFDENLPAWQDYDLWLRLCERYGYGWRTDARSYIQHLDHELERISSPERIRKAYELFVEKHHDILSETDRVSLELLMFATSHEKIPWSKLGSYFRAGLARRAASAAVSNHLPFLRPWIRQLQAMKRIPRN